MEPDVTVEHWLPAPGYEGLYSVSSIGRVRIEVGRHGINAGDILATYPNWLGYIKVTLRRNNEFRGKQWTLSRLVLTTFVGVPIPPTLQANHKNGDKADNTLHNLEWVTPQENTRHSIEELGNHVVGGANHNSKMTEEQVLNLREEAAAGAAFAALARKFGIHPCTAKNIAQGRTWKTTGGPRAAKRQGGSHLALERARLAAARRFSKSTL